MSTTTSMLDIIKAQLDRMEALQKEDHAILVRVDNLQKEDHAILLEIEDAVTVDPAVSLNVTAGPPEEQP